MILRELIVALESVDPEKVVEYGFDRPHSYRGYYSELAFHPARDVRVGDMLNDARESLVRTFAGYKGGDFEMHDFTDVYLAEWGCTGEELTASMLGWMLFGSPVGGAWPS